MPDDLSKLTPTDPSAVDPDWGTNRKRILDGVLAGSTQRRRGIGRWVAGVAAAALVFVAVGGVAQQLRPEPYATPAASPSASASSPQLLAAQSLLLGEGDEMGLCIGGVMESRPPQCSTVPVTGIAWEDVPWAETANGVTWGDATIVGTFDGGSFVVTQVFEANDTDAPQPPGINRGGTRPSLCETPTTGTGSSSTTALVETAEQLPGYQGLWSSDDQGTFNVAVTKNIEGAESALAAAFGGQFCVGTVDGPTERTLKEARQALEPLSLGPLMPATDPPADLNGGASIWMTAFGVTAQGNRLSVHVVQDSADLRESIRTTVGQDVWEFTDVIPFFYSVEDAVPPAPVGDESLVAAQVTLVDRDDGMTLCNGFVLASLPPGCAQSTDVRGLAWDEVSWAETIGGVTFAESTIIVGTFDGDAFVATEVFRDNDPEAPQPPRTVVDEELPTLCEAPITGAGPDSQDALMSAARNLPGYQALWISPDQLTWHVAVTEDLEGARSKLSDAFGGSVCVGTLPGPTDRSFNEAQEALRPLMSEGVVWGMGRNITGRGVRLEVDVALDTPEVLAQVQTAVGAEIWPHTDVIPFFYPAEGTPPSDTQLPSPAPTVPNDTASSAFTDEQHGWAEETVAGVLESMGQPDKPDVTALMAKATYGQYMEVWNIDIPEPPGPPSNDDDVLVVAVSGPLDGKTLKGGPPQLITPGATAGPRLQEPVGTVTVLDTNTGENLSHATVVGGESATDSIMKLSSPVEEVALPDGFR